MRPFPTLFCPKKLFYSLTLLDFSDLHQDSRRKNDHGAFILLLITVEFQAMLKIRPLSFTRKMTNVFLPIYTRTKKRHIEKSFFFDQYMEKYCF